MEILSCDKCGKEWERERLRGVKPKYCEICRPLVISNNRRARFKYKHHNCILCGQDLLKRKKGGQKKYCKKCLVSASLIWRETAKETNRNKTKRRRHECVICGTVFCGHKRKTCSEECRLKRIADREKKRPPRYTIICQCCGSEHKTNIKDGKYCSLLCAGQCKPKGPVGVSLLCRWCGGEYDQTGWNQSYCSKSCRNKQDMTNKRYRKNSVWIEEISIAVLYDRDRGRCGICGKKVDTRLVFPHPKSSTIDHIMPVSKGGEHRYSNVQLAHLTCNSRKGNRADGQQLLLIG